MAEKYHYNAATGRASLCRAETRNCPLDSGDNHREFSSKEESNNWAKGKREGSLSEKYSPMKGSSKGFDEKHFFEGFKEAVRTIGLPKSLAVFDFSYFSNPEILKTFKNYKEASRKIEQFLQDGESNESVKNDLKDARIWAQTELCRAIEDHLDSLGDFDIEANYADWLIHDYSI